MPNGLPVNYIPCHHWRIRYCDRFGAELIDEFFARDVAHLRILFNIRHPEGRLLSALPLSPQELRALEDVFGY